MTTMPEYFIGKDQVMAGTTLHHASENESFLNVQDMPVQGEAQELPSVADELGSITPCLYSTKEAIWDLKEVSKGFGLYSEDNSQLVEQTVGGEKITFNFCKERIATA